MSPSKSRQPVSPLLVGVAKRGSSLFADAEVWPAEWWPEPGALKEKGQASARRVTSQSCQGGLVKAMRATRAQAHLQTSARVRLLA